MKKFLFRKIIIGLVFGCILASFVNFVNADLNGTVKSVKVGSVTSVIYSYEIDMDNFGIYDWIYNNETKKFEWANGCKAYTYEAGMGVSEGMYSDSKCSIDVTNINDGDTYYARVSNMISITDDSTYGKISADVEYVPSNNYKWTGMEIKTFNYECSLANIVQPDENNTVSIENYYTDNTCTSFYSENATFVVGTNTAYTYYPDYFANVSVPHSYAENPSSYSLALRFIEVGQYKYASLNGSSKYLDNYSVRTAYAIFNPFIPIVDGNENHAAPVAGDTLGTLTINIHENLN